MNALALASLSAAAGADSLAEEEDLPPMIKRKERGGNPAVAGAAAKRPAALSSPPDPPGLQQVAATTYETGLRGRFSTGPSETSGRIEWNFGLFRTDATGEIFGVPSTIISTGFFQNVGNTRRQGVEAGVNYCDDKRQVGVDYTFLDAPFRAHLDLPRAGYGECKTRPPRSVSI